MLQEAFRNEVVMMLQRKLGENASIERVCVKKVNRDYEGIIIKMQGEVVVPTFSIPNYFQEYQKGRITVEGVADDMISKLNHGGQTGAAYLAKNIMNPEWIKANVQIKVINYERNLEYLQNVPFEKFLDLALILYVAIPVRDGQGSITIQNHLLEELGLEREEVFLAARQNMNHKNAVIRDMKETLCSLLASEGFIEQEVENELGMVLGDINNESDATMFVVTNEEQINGAQMLVKQGVLQQLAYLLRSNKIFIMPSSLHEIIGISSEGIDPVQLQEMVQSINQTELSEEEFLSNSVYLYDSIRDIIEVVA